MTNMKGKNLEKAVARLGRPRRNKSRDPGIGGQPTKGASAGAAAVEQNQNSNQNQDDWRVAELYIERKGNRSIVGNVYKGKVDNVLPGLEAAFVDIGLDKNGFLHADDIVFPGVEVARRGRSGRGPEGQADHRAAQAGPGDPRAGDQGPAEDQGSAPVHAALDRRALPGLRARRAMAWASRAGWTTRSATVCAGPPPRRTWVTAG